MVGASGAISGVLGLHAAVPARCCWDCRSASDRVGGRYPAVWVRGQFVISSLWEVSLLKPGGVAFGTSGIRRRLSARHGFQRRNVPLWRRW
jgi:hypothetical protein